jgi:hypothetical protein
MGWFEKLCKACPGGAAALVTHLASLGQQCHGLPREGGGEGRCAQGVTDVGACSCCMGMHGVSFVQDGGTVEHGMLCISLACFLCGAVLPGLA